MRATFSIRAEDVDAILLTTEDCTVDLVEGRSFCAKVVQRKRISRIQMSRSVYNLETDTTSELVQVNMLQAKSAWEQDALEGHSLHE